MRPKSLIAGIRPIWRTHEFYRTAGLWLVGALGAFAVTWYFLSLAPLESQPKVKSTHPRVISVEKGRLKESTGPRVIRVDEDRPRDSTGPRVIRLDGDRSKRAIISSEVHVVDGDTIRVRQKKPDVRLVGFNAPETGGLATCPAERELGAKATRRLRELVQAGGLEFHFVDCACPAGTQLTPACNHGRHCGTLMANGRDVGTILIAEGLAVPFKCGATSCPPTPKPWCKSIGPAKLY
jgi:endonuclease YncB( thermonuclease family)